MAELIPTDKGQEFLILVAETGERSDDGVGVWSFTLTFPCPARAGSLHAKGSRAVAVRIFVQYAGWHVDDGDAAVRVGEPWDVTVEVQRLGAVTPDDWRPRLTPASPAERPAARAEPRAASGLHLRRRPRRERRAR